MSSMFVFDRLLSSILGLQPRDMVAMLVVNTANIISKNFHENGVNFP